MANQLLDGTRPLGIERMLRTLALPQARQSLLVSLYLGCTSSARYIAGGLRLILPRLSLYAAGAGAFPALPSTSNNSSTGTP